MSVRPYRDIQRRACRKIHVGKVPVGGDAPITVQSMTNTVTSDVKATVEQIQALERAGADIVRVSCPDRASARVTPRGCGSLVRRAWCRRSPGRAARRADAYPPRPGFDR